MKRNYKYILKHWVHILKSETWKYFWLYISDLTEKKGGCQNSIWFLLRKSLYFVIYFFNVAIKFFTILSKHKPLLCEEYILLDFPQFVLLHIKLLNYSKENIKEKPWILKMVILMRMWSIVISWFQYYG